MHILLLLFPFLKFQNKNKQELLYIFYITITSVQNSDKISKLNYPTINHNKNPLFHLFVKYINNNTIHLFIQIIGTMNTKLETITKRKNQKRTPEYLIYNPLVRYIVSKFSFRLKIRRKNEFSLFPSLLNRRRNINPGITSAAIRLILRPQSSQKIFKSGPRIRVSFPLAE